MKARIQLAGLPVPVSQQFADILIKHIATIATDGLPSEVVINFRDPDYSATEGGYHPVEVRLELVNGEYHIRYITDFAFVGQGWCAELAKALDFDIENETFEMLYMPPMPLKRQDVAETYLMFESNFISYYQMEIFTVEVS